MNRHLDPDLNPDENVPNGEPVSSGGESSLSAPDLSRRAFVGGSAALLGSLLWSGDAQAQAADAASGVAKSAPHGFGMRSVASRAPLMPSAFVPLPLGSVRARGWLLQQLELQREGLTGHAEEVLPATAPNSAWKGGNGEDWEKGPYYLKGLIPLAYTLGDETLKARAQAWIEPILTSQRPDGFFGPTKNNDWWPRMVATYLLRDYAEATNDARVVPFLTRYYRHMNAELPARPLRDWGRARAGDEIDTVLWLYNRTGDSFLLSLADLLASQAYPWRQIFTENRFLEYGDDFHTKHNVNVPQALKMPVVYSQRSGQSVDKAAYRAGLAHLMQDHGSAFGISTGTEMLAGRSSVAGVETCSVVEYMLSAETALRVLGEARIGDELELVAFNALPAAVSKDMRQHVYYTLSNNVTAPRGEVGYEQNYGNARTPSPISGFPCCCYNLHMGWPKLAQNSWAATRDGGLAILAYVPSQVLAPVTGDQSARITCDTNYPFEETIRLTVNVDKPTRFPLQVRIPGWCRNPQIQVNGKAQPKMASGSFASISREWKDGDRVELTFPMQPSVTRGVNGSATVQHGPLIYALGLDEKWTAFEKGKVAGFDSYEVTSDSPWNFALVLDERDPARSLRAVRKSAQASTKNPFATGQSPVSLQVLAKRLDAWKLRSDALVSLDPPPSPVSSDAPAQTLELVPFGTQMLRVSEFPVVGTPAPLAKTWQEDFGGDYSQRWVVYDGGFVRDQKLHLSRTAKGVAPRAVFADFTYEGEVTVGDKGNAGVIFRVTEPSVGTDYYRGYYVGISAEGDEVTFGKSSYKWQELVAKPKSIEPGRAYRVRIEARGAQIRVWVDDMAAPILEASDDSFASGVLGVRSYSNKALFGRMSARQI